MGSWIFSLQFRLVLSFTLVLALALGGVSWYVGYAAEREADRFQQKVEESRAARLGEVVTRHYSRNQAWAGLQTPLEQAGSLYGWRIVVRDTDGRVVADTQKLLARRVRVPRPPGRLVPVVSNGRQVGFIAMVPEGSPDLEPEPTFSRLASELNRSLLWAGLAAGAAGFLLVAVASRQVLAPVRVLGSVARRLGQGDLSRRASLSGRDEVAQLGRTLNSMAKGLERAEQQRRSLMADVAHELRTPLSNIQGYVEAMRDGLLQPDSSTLDTVYTEIQQLGRLVEDLRLLAQAEAGDLHLALEPDSLEEVLRRSVEAFRPRAGAKDVTISMDVPPGFPLVHMDRTRIAQVVSNLLENAVLHTPQGGRVSVVAEVPGTGVARFTVSDTGEGIAPEDLAQVFERFYRVDPSRSRTTGGIGLGLTIAKRIVEAHGGTIRAESTPGEGSNFVVDLPLESHEARTRGSGHI